MDVGETQTIPARVNASFVFVGSTVTDVITRMLVIEKNDFLPL